MVDLRHASHGGNRRALAGASGFSLLELLASLGLLGLLVGVSITYAPDSLGNLTSKVDSRRLALDLLHCRRAAIATGDNHGLVFHSSGGRIDGYTPTRTLADGTVAIDQMRRIPNDLTVKVSPAAPEFTFEGTALTACTIELRATNRTSVVTVTQATGTVTVEDR